MSFDGSRGPPSIEGMTSLKVDNLTYRTTIEDLKRVFQKHGDVGDVYIPRDPRNHESRGFAFVRFYEKRDAEDAMDVVDGMVLDGREIRVQNAKYGRPASDYRPRGPRGGGGRYGGGGGGSRYRRSYSPRRRRSRSRSYSPRRRSRSRSPRRRKSRSKSRSPRRRPQSKSPQQTRRDSDSRSPRRQRSRSGSPKRRSRSPAKSGSPAENGSKSPSQDRDNE